MKLYPEELEAIAKLIAVLDETDNNVKGVYLQGPLLVMAEGRALGTLDSPDGLWEFTPEEVVL